MNKIYVKEIALETPSKPTKSEILSGTGFPLEDILFLGKHI